MIRPMGSADGIQIIPLFHKGRHAVFEAFVNVLVRENEV